MLWKALPKAALASLIEQMAPGLLDRLEALLPLIGDKVGDIGDRTALATIAESFLPSDLFFDQDACRLLLRFMPPARLERLIARIAGEFHDADTFDLKLETILQSPATALIGALVELGEVDARFLPAPPKSIPGRVHVEPASDKHPACITRPFRQLLDYQHFLYAKCAEALDSPRARAILHMPTGAGKTRTALEIVASRLNASDAAVVVWVAHSEELCDQAFDSFLDVYLHLAQKPVAAVRNWGGLHQGKLPEGSAFVVTTYQTLCRNGGALANIAEDRIQLIVADEAHMVIAPKYMKAILKYAGRQASILGLTATPVRSDDTGSDDLREFFFGTIVSSSDHGDFTTSSLQRRRILATPTFITADSNTSITVTEKESEELAERQDVSGRILRVLSEEASRNALIARHCITLAREHKSVLVFACGVEHSRFIASLLLTCGIKASHVDATSDPSHRRTTIESFRRGETRVLCNFGVLTTGFDAPNIDAVVLARPTLSPVLYSQMVGRAMRGPVLGGKASTIIIDIRDSFLMFGAPLDLFERFHSLWKEELA